MAIMAGRDASARSSLVGSHRMRHLSPVDDLQFHPLSLPYNEWLVVGPDPVVDTPSIGHHRAGQGDLMDDVRRPDRQGMSRLKAPFEGKIHRTDYLLCKVCDPRDARVRGSQNEPCALTIAFALGEYGESAARRRKLHHNIDALCLCQRDSPDQHRFDRIAVHGNGSSSELTELYPERG